MALIKVTAPLGNGLQLMWRLPLVFVAVLSILCPAWATGETRLNRISAEEVSIPVADGAGSSRVPFLVEAGSPEPQCVATDAKGPLNTIPSADIKLTWAGGYPSAGKRTLATLVIQVMTTSLTEPGVDYSGSILCFWSDSAANVSFGFRIKPQPAAEYSVEPETLDVAIGPDLPDQARLSIRNTGRTAITQIFVSSAGLTDPTTRAAVGPFSVSGTDLAVVPLAPGEEKQFTVLLPRPVLAGAFAGQLNVLVNDRVPKHVALTLRTRGPNAIPILSRAAPFEYLVGLPALLFLLTLMIGYGVSLLLEAWFAGGGLERATAIRALYGSLHNLDIIAEHMRDWESEYGSAFTNTNVRRDLLTKEIMNLLARGDGVPQTQLADVAARAEQTLPFYEALWRATEVATEKIQNADQRLQTVRALDGIEPGSDLAAYRKELEKTIEQSARSRSLATAGLATVVSLPVDSDAMEKQLAAIRRRMRLMEWLQRLVVWVGVLGVAYLTFWFGKLSFGTLQDYINVFFWAVGLTQTGSQLLARARAGHS